MPTPIGRSPKEFVPMLFQTRLTRRATLVAVAIAGLASATAYPRATGPQAPQAATTSAPSPAPAVNIKDVVDRYCVGCHNQRMKAADLVLENQDLAKLDVDAETWERVVQKLLAAAMPPAGSRRPDAQTMTMLIAALQDGLDRASA